MSPVFNNALFFLFVILVCFIPSSLLPSHFVLLF